LRSLSISLVHLLFILALPSCCNNAEQAGFWPLFAFRFVCKVTLDLKGHNGEQMGKVHKATVRHTADIQQHDALP